MVANTMSFPSADGDGKDIFFSFGFSCLVKRALLLNQARTSQRGTRLPVLPGMAINKTDYEQIMNRRGLAD
jgi:hypothetical protein